MSCLLRSGEQPSVSATLAFCTISCCLVKPHMACWVRRTLTYPNGELLVGMDCCIFHSSSLMAEICAVWILAVSCKCLINIWMIAHSKTLKCILHFLLPFNDWRRPPVLSDTHTNAASQKMSCVRWAKVIQCVFWPHKIYKCIYSKVSLQSKAGLSKSEQSHLCCKLNNMHVKCCWGSAGALYRFFVLELCQASQGTWGQYWKAGA